MLHVTERQIDTILTDRIPHVQAYGFYPSLGEWIAVDTTSGVAFANHLPSEGECRAWLTRCNQMTVDDVNLLTALVVAHFAGATEQSEREQERRILVSVGRMT